MEEENKIHIPYRCPVCNGRGLVPFNFYNSNNNSSNIADEKCKFCNGVGIIWSIDNIDNKKG